jgi:hypothetical protein
MGSRGRADPLSHEARLPTHSYMPSARVIRVPGALACNLPSQPQPIIAQRKRCRSTIRLTNRSTARRRTRYAGPRQRGHSRCSMAFAIICASFTGVCGLLGIRCSQPRVRNRLYAEMPARYRTTTDVLLQRRCSMATPPPSVVPASGEAHCRRAATCTIKPKMGLCGKRSA